MSTSPLVWLGWELSEIDENAPTRRVKQAWTREDSLLTQLSVDTFKLFERYIGMGADIRKDNGRKLFSFLVSIWD